MLRDNALLPLAALVRRIGNLAKDLVAESQSAFRVRFFAQRLFQHFCHKCCIADRLFFMIDFTKYSSQLRVMIKRFTEKLINKPVIYARDKLFHQEFPLCKDW